MDDLDRMRATGTLTPRAVELARQYAGLRGDMPLDVLANILAMMDVKTPMIDMSTALPPHPYFQIVLLGAIAKMGAQTITDRMHHSLKSEPNYEEKRRTVVEFAGELAKSTIHRLVDFEGELLDCVHAELNQDTGLLQLMAVGSGNASLALLAMAGRGTDQERALQTVRSEISRDLVEPLRPTVGYVSEQALAACLQFYSANKRVIDRETLVHTVEGIFETINENQIALDKAARTPFTSQMFMRRSDELLRKNYIRMFIEPAYPARATG
jgi:hypothetical protein